MKKNVLLIIFCVLISTTFFAQTKIYELGKAQSKRGVVDVEYVNVGKAGKGDYIKLSLKKLKVYANIFLPKDLKDVRRHIDKFTEWRQTAIDNDYYVLNKKIGDLSAIRIDFATIGKNYEIVFLEKRTGLKIVSFDLEQIQAFKEIITDDKIITLIIIIWSIKKQSQIEGFYPASEIISTEFILNNWKWDRENSDWQWIGSYRIRILSDSYKKLMRGWKEVYKLKKIVQSRTP